MLNSLIVLDRDYSCVAIESSSLMADKNSLAEKHLLIHSKTWKRGMYVVLQKQNGLKGPTLQNFEGRACELQWGFL